MKTLLTLAMLTLTLPTLAHAAKKAACAFGETTHHLTEMFEQKDEGKRFYRNEFVQASPRQRLGGLSASEKKMILFVNGEEHATGNKAKELLNNFADSDGSITIFAENEGEREFALVSSYPGDNEFGMILEIARTGKGRASYKILDIAASISDGDLVDCQVK